MRKLRKAKMLASLAAMLMVSAAFIPLFSVPAMAQTTTGSISGTVTDQAGAVVPGATVTAKNQNTGVSSPAYKSTGVGLYNIASLTPGTYTLSVEAANFKRAVFTDIEVKLGQTVTIDALLQPGGVTETVTVTASGEETIQKTNVQQSSSFEARKVADLPANIAGGGIDTLALLAPGVVPGFGNVNSNGGTLSVNGQRARSNNFTIDGGDNNDLSIGGPSFFVDNQDIVGEFQVITNNFSAEYGRNQGAIVNIVTKAGTNDFHGTAAWFHRDRREFDSLTNIEKRGGLADPTPFLYNVYSGTIGGPIIKERAFFFGSYQETTGRDVFLAQSTTPSIAAEELARLRANVPNNIGQAYGNFSAFAITDLGSLTERPDFPQDGFVTIGGQNYRVAYPQREIPDPFNQHEFSVRGDVKITDKHAAWYRHLYQTVDNVNALGGSDGFTGNIPASGNLASATFTSQVSNTSVNEFRFIWNRLSVIFGGGCEGLKGCVTDPGVIGDSLTNISFTGLRDTSGTSLKPIGAATNLPQGRVVTVYQFQDNFSKTLGRHQFKFGADIRRLNNSVPFLPTVNGAFRFPNSDRFVANNPSFANIAAGTVAITYNETDQFFYFQDDWRIKDNLTLNLGLRYEYIGQPINTLNDISVARESDASTALWKQSLPLEARTFAKLPADKNNFAPRLGIVWSPRFGDSKIAKTLFGEADQSVISAGYSVAYDPPFYNIMLNISTSSPLVFLNTTNNPAPPGAAIFPLPSANPTGNAVQEFARNNQIIAVNLFDPKFFNQTIVSRDFYSPYIQQWSLRFQREIGRNNVFEVRYVGNHAVGLFQTLNRNPRVDRFINGFALNIPGLGVTQFPGFPNLVPQGTTFQTAGVGACVDNPATTTLNEANACNGRLFPEALVRSRENTAQSTYHGLQSRYQARMFNQLSLGVAYTWSKALDNASEIFSFNETANPQNPFNSSSAEKGVSGFNRTHALSMNWVWDVPIYKDQNGLIGRLLGGWQINGTYFLASGRNFTPSQFCNFACIGGPFYEDTTFDGTFIGRDSLRPFYGNPNAPATSVGITQIDAALLFGVPVVNAAGFWSFNELNGPGNIVAVTKDQVRYIFNGPGAAKVFGTPFGDVGRGSAKGRRLNNLNMGLFKNVKLSERWKLQLRAEGFNVLNHPNPSVGFIAQGSTPDFFVDDGGAPDGFFDLGGVEYARRAWQFGAKIIF